jgi:hypothetical protein
MSHHVLRGSCHCGNLSAELETARAPQELAVRSCQCSFCARHRARTTSDPAGRVRFVVRDEALLNRYQFGLRSAQMLVCRQCGGYVGAFMPATAGSAEGFGVANINHFERSAEFTQEPAKVDYDGESLERRRARREQLWTPATIAQSPGH